MTDLNCGYLLLRTVQVMAEFATACRATAVAISEGLIAPLALGDPAHSDIYVYNGIFFSKAEDSKDSFKVRNAVGLSAVCARHIFHLTARIHVAKRLYFQQPGWSQRCTVFA
jgi:hypothetical protein